MIRWDRLTPLVVPVAVIVALICAVRGAWVIWGEGGGLLATAAALIFLAVALDRDSGAGQQQEQRGGAYR